MITITENEIIDFLEDEINGLKEQKYGDLGEIAAEVFKEINGDERIKVFRMAISALKEVQQYRKIGTVKECREAVEKQKPKKIIIEPYCPTECPTCGHELSTSLGDGYYKYPTFLERCPNCGQAIQW